MTLSEALKALEQIRDQYGDVELENQQGTSAEIGLVVIDDNVVAVKIA